MTVKRYDISFTAELDLELLELTREKYPAITPGNDDPAYWSTEDLVNALGPGDPDESYPMGAIDKLTITEIGEVEV